MSDIPTRLLRETLRGRMAPATRPGCLDTNTLAAWSDGTLRARERAAAELHASSCARCQSLVAMMARTLPPAPTTKRRWPSTTLAWLTPVAAAAVAVLVWISVPRPPFESAVPPQAEGRASAASAPPTASAGGPSSAASSPTISVDRLADSKAAQRRDIQLAPPVALAPKRAVKAEEQSAGVATRATQEVDSPERERRAATEMRDAATAPPPAAPSPSRGEARRLNAGTEAAPTETAVGSQSPTMNPLQSARLMRAEAGSGPRAISRVAPGATEILSPDANVRWRVLPGGNVARSIDGGTTWQTQSTGVPSTLTAGSAPSPTICWLVGPRGIIVMSTDGQNWHRVPFPESIDLTSIRATDASNAAVTAADGRTLTTTDGGKTWRQP